MLSFYAILRARDTKLCGLDGLLGKWDELITMNSDDCHSWGSRIFEGLNFASFITMQMNYSDLR